MSTRYNTGNPIESTDVRDMSDNAKNFDEFANSTSETFTDRFGIGRLTAEGAIEKTGFKPGAGDFSSGFTVLKGMRNIAWLNPKPLGDNNWYSWSGAIPESGKVVPPNSTPKTSGGFINGWAPRTDQALFSILQTITPEMFYSGTGPHSVAVQAAFDRSNATGELVYLGGQYLFDVPVTVKNNVNVISGQRASVSPYPGSNNGTAFDFAAGNSNRRFELPALSAFSQVGGPAVAVRCDLAQIYVRQFVGCHTCFKTIADAGNNSVLDVIMEFNTMSACEVAWEMYCGASSNIVQGCVLKGNFITDTTRVLKRTGVAAFDDGNVVDVYAVDFTTRCAGGAFLDNQVAGSQVSRFTANVQSWFGGDGFTLAGADAVRVVSGQFVEGDMSLALVTGLLQESLPANKWRAGVLKTSRTAASLGQVRNMPNTPTLASFNGGVPLSDTEFIVRLTLTADLAAGAQAVGYFWNVFADGSYPRWSAVPIEGNTRLMLASIKDQSSTEASRVEIAVRNTSGANIVAGQNVIFRVSRR